ncbi:MAG: M20/M25/M40 family metallo-hydrolase [Myxococcales bacterium]|nr:M20/M25/M40 family metallo-hydrolase [Myxococcales bacterium]MCB9580893.1 M20/M25/M40 family metallo-hydrolase [Polyangiaceae bacterium]
MTPLRTELFPLLALLLVGCGSESSSSPTTGSGGAAGAGGAGGAVSLESQVDAARLQSDVELIAKPRPPGSAQWQAVQDLCAERFAQYGFEVERQKYATGVNVIGRLAGKTKPAEQVIVSAHYDHISGCPGADDNASGVAGVLETARILSQAQYERSLVVACWDEEEAGLIGSEAYAARAAQQGDTVASMVSLEMIGYRDTAPNSQSVPAGFNLLFGDEYAKIEANQFRADFVAIVAIDSASTAANAMRSHAEPELPTALLLLDSAQAQSPLLADLTRSDHASFWQHGYPAIMLTDTSNFRYAQYHCIGGDDVPSLLDYGFMAAITRANLSAQVDVLGRL